MGISRLLLLIALGVAIWLLLRAITRRKQLPKQRRPDNVDEMVRCEFCGVHLPRSDAIKRDNRFYCCEEHSHKS